MKNNSHWWLKIFDYCNKISGSSIMATAAAASARIVKVENEINFKVSHFTFSRFSLFVRAVSSNVLYSIIMARLSDFSWFTVSLSACANCWKLRDFRFYSSPYIRFRLCCAAPFWNKWSSTYCEIDKLTFLGSMTLHSSHFYCFLCCDLNQA